MDAGPPPPTRSRGAHVDALVAATQANLSAVEVSEGTIGGRQVTQEVAGSFVSDACVASDAVFVVRTTHQTLAIVAIRQTPLAP